ncbi:MAG: hypothetical protein QOE90_2397 [Thermoplasmata archaeon]|nr:hypothetical protein [Thermoplasmata archaeon]
MHVRRAEPRDFDAVSALLVELGGGRPPLPTEPARLAAVRDVYERVVAQGFSFVAEEEGRVVGAIVADLRERLNHPTPEVWIADLVVTEAFRGRGAGAHRISLESGHWRKDAHRFYKREGFEDLALHFSMALRPRV